MVRVSCFEFKLVEAESKKAFREYCKDGKTYFEVEPDVEYFISVQKVGKSENHEALKVKMSVDGKDLGYSIVRKGHQIDKEQSFKGIRSRVDGTSIHKAFVFTKPQTLIKEASANPGMSMGKVELGIYEATVGSMKTTGDYSAKRFAVPVVDVCKQTGPLGKKALRSGEGSSTIVGNTRRTKVSHPRGAHLATVVLHYSAAPALIATGVHSAAHLQVPQESKRPASSELAADVKLKKIRTVHVKPEPVVDLTGDSKPKTVPVARLDSVVDLTGD
mmetsp:Transcript_6382/g.15504  ORF Transcript_6382/g.15504 Transcript_6382/m.15504 type:complete len:274 (+) Transcript_6382:227-1048(+)